MEVLTSVATGVWTLIFGALIGVEKFTIRKLAGVVASLVGIILISRVDLSASEAPPADDGGGSRFPNKSSTEIALGDAMAGFSAVMYGVYTIVLKKQVGDESRVNMQLFFGLVNSVSSLLSDICWAYAMLLTTPLVVTVGLSLTIPLSLVGQIFLQGITSSALYWVGAAIVFLSFLVVNHESKEKNSEEASTADYDAIPGEETGR
ncbi:hypothetical protein APSETT445_005244 [Aspergillus pseudonomiae]